jgi:hypothetical protein
MSVKLTEDCFDEIINYITDRKTLYYLLLINRFFCRKITPKLWSSPFALLEQSSPFLIRTYMSCLSKKEKESLSRFGLPYRIARNRRDKPPLFAYPSYLKEFDFWCLKSSVEEWVNFFGCEKHLKMDPFFRYFLKTLLKRCQNIQILRWFSHEKSYLMPDIRIFSYKEHNIFTNIRELHCGGYFLDPLFYRQLSIFCRNITKIYVLHYHKLNDPKLADLIEKQNGLQTITFHSLSGGTWRLVNIKSTYI